MASSYDNVQVSILSDDERFVHLTDEPVKLELARQTDCVTLTLFKGITFLSLVLTNEQDSHNELFFIVRKSMSYRSHLR